MELGGFVCLTGIWPCAGHHASAGIRPQASRQDLPHLAKEDPYVGNVGTWWLGGYPCRMAPAPPSLGPRVAFGFSGDVVSKLIEQPSGSLNYRGKQASPALETVSRN